MLPIVTQPWKLVAEFLREVMNYETPARISSLLATQGAGLGTRNGKASLEVLLRRGQ